jgi:hypothetical protein
MPSPFTDLPAYGIQSGLQTPFGIVLPPAQQVLYVRSTGPQSGDSPDLVARLLPTLAQALAYCRAGLGDTVVCLPGHSESVTDATMLTNLVAGTKVIGLGRGGNMPVFRWTATGSQWAVAVADVVFANLRLRLEGANGVVKAIAVTAADVQFVGCDIEVSSGAANLATIALEIGTGAHRFSLVGSRLRGVAAGVATDGILVAAAASNIEILDNDLEFAATSASGLIRVAAAALDMRIGRNIISNVAAASIAGISFGAQASSGVVHDNRIRCQSTGAQVVGTTGLTVGATTICSFFQNFITNEPRTNGVVISPAADT